MRVDNVNFTAKNNDASKEPRYTIELSFDFANTDLHYFTSHSDAQIPIGAVSTASVVSGISGTSQKITPDKGRASIGAININLVDLSESISTLFNTKLDIGSGLNGKRVRVYTSFEGEVWNDYVLIQTQIIDSVTFDKGNYILKLADIQRSERKDIFDFKVTNLSESITETQLTIPVFSVSGFEFLEHGTSYSDAPSNFGSPQNIKTVLYLKVEDEIIRCIGTTTNPTLAFVVDSDGASPLVTGRGVLNTRASAHQTDTSLQDNSRKTKVEEYIYIEMPVPKLIYALMTGNLEGQAGKTLPSNWHLNISTDFVRLSDFTGIGDDWWTTTDDNTGVIGNFQGLKKQDAKKFIETELNLMVGAYNPIYSDGALGLRRMTNVLSSSGFKLKLDETNIKSFGALVHDMRSLQNSFQINWNWDNTTEQFTRTSLLIDQDSITKHGDSKLTNLSFKGLSGNRHKEETIFALFNSLRDRYTGPPLRLKVQCLPSLNILEVGDVVNVKLTNVRDFNGTLAPLDRSFEIQGIQIDWITGNVSLDLFGSSQSAGALPLGSVSSVLNDSFYTSAGTELQAYVNGLTSPNGTAFTVISGIGHITQNITLAGSTPSTIYYYDGPLEIDNGVTVTITNTIELRVRGNLAIEGIINGVGNGPAGVVAGTEYPQNTLGTKGYLGNTLPMGGAEVYVEFYFGGMLFSYDGKSTKALVTESTNRREELEFFNLLNNTSNDTLTNVPRDLRGTSGAGGGNFKGFKTGNLAIGGNGGAGGAGICTISRGVTMGTSAQVILNGDAGTVGGFSSFYATYAGGGAGGCCGCWLILLDGQTIALPVIGSKFVGFQGDTPVLGRRATAGIYINERTNSITFPTISSYFQGYGTPAVDRSLVAHKIQFIPEDQTAIEDVPSLTVIPPTLLVLSSGDNSLLKALDGTIISRLHVSWTASIDQNIGGYEAEYKISSDANWIPASATVNLEISDIFISPVQDGIDYDCRIRAINNIGVRSEWIELLSYTIIGKLAPPPDADSFLVQRLADGTRVFDGGLLSSNRPVDFAGYEIRAATGNGLPWESLSPLHVGVITQLPYETNQLAAGTYTAGIKVIDTTGIESTNAVLVDSTLGDPRISNAIVTVDFRALGFPDIKTNCWVETVTSELIATDIYTWANFATGSPIQTWADWLEWATNPNSPIIYEHAAIDIGVITTFTPLVSVTSNGTTLLIQESHSDDDITYTAFATAGPQVSGRYIKIKFTVTNAVTAPIVTQALVILDADIVEEYIEDLDTSTVDLGSPRVAGDIRLPLVKGYTAIKSVQIALQNVGAGWSWELIDKTVTGPRIKIYNASNVLSDATIDAFISGA